MVGPAQRQEAPWASPVLLFPWKAIPSAGEGQGAHPRKVSPAAAPSVLEKLPRELLPGGTGLQRGRRRGGSAAWGGWREGRSDSEALGEELQPRWSAGSRAGAGLLRADGRAGCRGQGEGRKLFPERRWQRQSVTG